MYKAIILLSISVLLLLGCAPDPVSTPTITLIEIISEAPYPTRTLSPFPTSTSTPLPTVTPTSIPTQTETPIPTPVPEATKPTLILYGIYGGDGGPILLNYLGRNTPNLVLYTDGQLIIMEGSRSRGFTIYETRLKTAEMCQLLSRIKSTGFFNVDPGNINLENKDQSPIYQFDKPYQPSDGGQSYILQINGQPAKEVDVYDGYRDILVNEVR